MKPPRFALGARWLRLIVIATVLVVGATTWSRWWPPLNEWVRTTLAGQKRAVAAAEGHGAAEGEHVEDGHDHAGHSEGTSLELSPQAMRNLGLTADYVRPVALQTYRKSITVPAVVVVRPGRTQLEVATPMTGVITHVHAVQGEAVEPGELLFQIRLTHEDLVQAQTEFLKALGELGVENREIARLEKATEGGAIAGKTLLERRYAKERLEALLGAQREALRLHGLSDRQVDQIASERRLLRELQLMAPFPEEHAHDEELRLTTKQRIEVSFQDQDSTGSSAVENQPPLIIDVLDVNKGQSVAAGARLCMLSDYSRLYIEGRAFEQDSSAMAQVKAKNWKVSATLAEGGTLKDLSLAYVASKIDPESRTLRFYVDLPNEIVSDSVNADGQRFVSWRYLPGQRVNLHVPVEEWPDQIVLPVDAVVEEGAETYVFLQNGNHFDRVAVHVKYRDQQAIVVANDGSIFPGDMIALRSAHQMLLALKNKAGGGIDPHAGHNH